MSYTLVLAEKPSVAMDYSKALDCNIKKDGYFEGNNFIVSWAFGHLFSLKEPQEYDESLKEWNLETLPIVPDQFSFKLIPSGAKQFKILKELINRPDVEKIYNGGDPGREGELIQRYILAAARNKKPVFRLWIPSLTPEEIKKGFKNVKPSSNYDNLYYSAAARNEIDWLIGLNYTRAYTKKKGKNVTLTIGRCQTPILNMIVERDLQFENFVPEPYYEIKAQFQDYIGKFIREDNTTKIVNREEAEKINGIITNKTGIIKSILKEIKSKPHPQLFNLTNLQKAMDRKYGFSAQKTLDLAQSLYEKHKILSYPRTASRYLSENMANVLPERLEKLNFGFFSGHINKIDLNNLKITKRFVDSSKLTDHHAIIPTEYVTEEIYSNLSNDEKKVFDEVVITFISCFYSDYKYENTIIITEVEKYLFRTSGNKELEKGWTEILDMEDDEEKEENVITADLSEGQSEKIINSEIENKKTKPLPRYTVATLLAQLEKNNIGTEATRAKLLENLSDREYVKRDKKSLISSQLGRDLINCIETELLKSVELTADLENKLEGIANGKVTKASIIKDVVADLTKNIQALKESNGEMVEKHNTVVGKCPKCKANVLSYKSGYGCENFKEQKCDFFLKNKISGQNISEKQVIKLLDKGSTDVIKSFKNKEGKEFDAAIILKEDGTIGFYFPEKLKCPICNKGIIIKGQKGYGCTEYKNGCKFFIGSTIAQKKITDSQVIKLVEKKKTPVIKGFKNKEGKEFNAALVLDNEGKIHFEISK